MYVSLCCLMCLPTARAACLSLCYKQALSMGSLLLNGSVDRPRIVVYYYWNYGQWSVLRQYCGVVDKHIYPGPVHVPVVSSEDHSKVLADEIDRHVQTDQYIHSGSDD